MALHTRRVITPVEDISARTSPASVRRRINPVSFRSTSKPLQVSFASPSARRPPQRAVAAGNAATQSSPIKERTDLLAKVSSSSQNHLQAHNHIEKVLSSHDHDSTSSFVKALSNAEDPIYENVHSKQNVVKEDDVEKEDQRQSEELLSPATEFSESGVTTKRGSGNTGSYYDGQSESDNEQNVGMDMGEERVGWSHERKQKLNQQELRSMASFAKAQGVDLMKQVEVQKRRKLEHDREAPDIAKAEMEEMRRILQERKRSSDEYFAPSETERDSSPERNSGRKRDVFVDQYSQRDSTELEISDEINVMANEDPSKVLDWLKSADEMDNHIVVSEDRTLSLLKAIKEGNIGFVKGSLPRLEEDWVPMERLREAERRSSIAEEQIRQFEELLNAAEGVSGDEQLHAFLARSKSMERHFHHLKKFAEDRHADLRKLYPNLSDKDGIKSWRPHVSGASPEKVRKDLQEHEKHRRRLMQVFAMYTDLLKFLRVEHLKRIEADSKTQQLASQMKRQTAALKRAEKVIKNTTLSPISVKDCFRGTSQADVRSPLASPSPPHSGTQSPTMASYSTQLSPFTFCGLQSQVHLLEDQERVGLVNRIDRERFDQGMPTLRQINTTRNSNLRAAALPSSTTPTPKHLRYDHSLEQALPRNPSTDPGAVLSNSDIIAENHKREFEELEKALIEQGRARGFADVDLYSQKKIVGREETCWEYRHVHFDFSRPHIEAGSASASRDQRWDMLDVHSISNLPLSKRTASPSRSEGAVFEDKHDHISTNVGPQKPLALLPSTSHAQGQLTLVKSNLDHQQKQRPQNESSLARIHALDKSTDFEFESIMIEGITRSTSAKQLDKETMNQQTKAYRRMQSSPAKITSLQLENSQLLHSNTAKHFALGDVTEDESWEDASHDALDEMWVDVAKDKLWYDAAGKEEDWADMTEDQSNEMAKATGTRSDDNIVLASMKEGYQASKGTRHRHRNQDTSPSGVLRSQQHDSQPHDLPQRIAAVESRHVAHLLQSQVGRRCSRLLFQILLLIIALLWSATWWLSVPPPT